MKKIRNSNRAIIVHEDKVLIIRVIDENFSYYIFPGGKQEFGETSIETIKRECQEEIGCSVKVNECVMIRGYIGPNRKNGMSTVSDMHIKELYFMCEPITLPDLKIREDEQIEITWVHLSSIEKYNVKPVFLKNNIRKIIKNRKSSDNIYVGDVD